MKSKRLGALFLAACFACSPLASAEVKTYEGTGEYVMSDFETPDIAKQRAKARAEQSCVEQAGVYVKSYTRVVDSAVTEDEVEAIANIIINVIDEKFVVVPVSESGGSFRVVATIKATVDSNRIDMWMERDHLENMKLVEENTRLKKEKIKQDEEISKLREKLLRAKSEKEKNNIEAEVVQADKKFLANQKIEEASRIFKTNNFVDAIALLSEAIGLDDKNPVAYCKRGLMYQLRKDYKHAHNDYDKAIEIDPEYVTAYVWRAFLLGGHQAIEDYSKAIQINPYEANTYISRAKTYSSLKDYKKALQDYNKAISISPHEGNWYFERAEFYRERGEYKEALDDYDKCLDLNPKAEWAAARRIEVYIKKENYQQVIEECNKCITKYMQSSGFLSCYYVYRAFAYWSFGKYEQALDDCNKSIEIAPKDSRAYYIRGLVYQNMGDLELANIDFRKAEECKTE